MPTLYIVFLMLPIYGLLAMSFKSTNEILAGFTFFPQEFTLENYAVIFADPTWTAVTLLDYLRGAEHLYFGGGGFAAYAFSRYRFLDNTCSSGC